MSSTSSGSKQPSPINRLHNSSKDSTSGDQGFRRKKTKQKGGEGFRRKKAEQEAIEDSEERRPNRRPVKDSEERRSTRSRSRIQKKEDGAEAAQTSPTRPPRCREEPKDVSKDQYDVSKDVQMFVSDEEVGHTFAYWYKRYGPVIRDSVLLDSEKRDLILIKLDEDAYRKYADDILPKQPHEIDFETTVAKLEKLFASKKTLIRRRYECLKINCPPLTASCVPTTRT